MHSRAPRGLQHPLLSRRVLGGYRIALAAIELAALIGNFSYVLGFSTFVAANFFSYFTIQSAMLAVVALTASGIFALARPSDPRWVGILRTVLMSYLVVSGIVFGLIVAQASTRSYRVDVPWSDALLHFVVPALALVAWLSDNIIAPRDPPTPWRTLIWVLPFPMVWLAFTLIRGDEVGWYPYFFLDPAQVGGVPGIIHYCVIVLAIFFTVTALLVSVSRLITARVVASRGRKATPAPGSRTSAARTATGSTELLVQNRRR